MNIRPTHIAIGLLGTAVVFAAGFIVGVDYARPTNGSYQLVPVGEEDQFETALLVARDSTGECEPTAQIVDLMVQCRESAIDGFGQDEACNDGFTSVPRNVAHLNEQIPIMRQLRDNICTRDEVAKEPNQ